MSLEQLLVVQEHDTKLRQLQHRRDNLDERQAAVDLEAKLATLNRELEQVTEERHEISREQKRIEDEVATVEAKSAKENEKLYSGAVTAIKELQALQDELASLKRRQDTLEDGVIECMEKAEPVDAKLGQLEGAIEQHQGELDDTNKSIAEIEAEIDGEMVEQSGLREQAADGIAGDILDAYERARAASGGVGAARFAAGRCEGCHLELSRVEADQLKKQPPDALVHCDSCGRILVR